jgi:EAL domain-containing protein (putative c-di-GMP-specific phosphodiesterase class I)
LAELICRGVVDSLSQTPFHVADKAFQVRGSIGAVEVTPGSAMKDALSTADTACRAAKRKQGVVICESGASVFKEHEVELALMEQFASGRMTGLFLEMQPIMSLSDPRGSLNMEALLRMRDEQGQLIPVSRVLSAAESSGRTATIDRWVLATTLGFIRDNWSRLARNKFVCMNLSGASLNDERFVADALQLLAQYPLAATRLCVEITEDVALHDLEVTSRFIDAVRKLGARVALDDFGAGYTSFNYLKQLKADVVKIDGSFIVDINADPANVTIVEAIVTLARNLGMKVIAEWAEDAETVRTLSEIGVDYVQGFAIARSQPLERIIEAESSADFILDGATRRVVEALAGQPLQPVAEVETRLHLVQ